MDHLTIDVDPQRMAGEAVAELLLATMRQDLPGKEPSALAQVENEQAQALGAALRVRTKLGDPWRREVVRVDGVAFALWVHRQVRGWAAIADLGSVTVSLFGRAQPVRWELALLSAQEAALALAERQGDRDVSQAVEGGQGWFGWTPH